MLAIFSESETAMGSSGKTHTHKVCMNTDTPTDAFLYINYRESRHKKLLFVFFFFPFEVQNSVSSLNLKI